MAQKPHMCTVDWCQLSFSSLKDMQIHKYEDPDHFYCKRCDVDCKDWEDLTNHKVDIMAPYIEGRDQDSGLKHIVCEFCGAEFKSWGGRRRHREQNHQATQDVKCPGCHTKFARASHFIEHLEFGRCRAISAHDFLDNVQRKRLQAQVMEGSGEFVTKMRDNSFPLAKAPKHVKFKQITEGSENLDQDDGGVSLLDAAIDPNIATALEAWPQSSKVEGSIRALSIDSNEPIHIDASKEGFPPLDQRFIKAGGDKTAGAWTAASSSKKLFPEAKKQKPTPEAQRFLAEHDKEQARCDKSNVMNPRYLDPHSLDYNVDRFRNGDIFNCPFPKCSHTFVVSTDVAEHIIDVHCRKSYVCTGCHKRFNYATSLIAHAESAGKCRVRDMTTFNQLLNEVSGGFLVSHAVHQQKLVRPEMALVKSGQVSDGVMDTKFKSIMYRGD